MTCPVPGAGLCLGGRVVPESGWIIRDGRAWWSPDDANGSARPRPAGVDVNLLVGHWTAGEAGVRRADDDGPFIYGVMRNRPSNDAARAAAGGKLKVSVHFVIGVDGTTWQTADPLTTVAVHVGMGAINTRSVGVEIVNPGTGPMHPERPRERIEHRMLPTPKLPRGRRVRQLAYYPAQIDAWCRLGELLADHLPIPRRVPACADGTDFEIDRFTRPEAARWKGAMEHYHVPTTTKVDAGTQLIRALRYQAGWDLVAP